MSPARIPILLLLSGACWLGSSRPGLTQHLTFTQSFIAAQQANPSLLALEQQMGVSGNYRYQTTGGGVTYKSVLLNAWMPLMTSRNGGPTATLGLLALDDRTTAGGLTFQTFGSSFAYGLSLNKTQRLAFGLMGTYARHTLDNTGATTASQYDPERGFDPSLPTGEVLTNLQSHYLGWNTGISWLKFDRWKQPLGYAGISAYNINTPTESFSTYEFPVAATVYAYTAYTVYERGQLRILPELHFSKTASQYQVQLGSLFRYILNYSQPEKGTIQLGGRYRWGRGVSLLGQLEQPGYTFGLSYDLGVRLGSSPTTGQHVVEVGFKIYDWVNGTSRKKKSKSKKKKKKGVKRSPESWPKQACTPDQKPESEKQKEAVSKDTPEPLQLPSITKKAWQDSHRDTTYTLSAPTYRITPLGSRKGQIEIGPETKQFHFATNATHLGPADKDYLLVLAAYLQQNPGFTLSITGHTDNTGSGARNLLISEKRALAVKRFLVLQGIDAGRITSRGVGMSEPLVPNTSEENKAINRRVTFTVHP